MAHKARPLLERFEEKFSPEPNSGCWLWTGSIYPDGYGQFAVNGSTNARSNRMAWILYRGPIPVGAQVLHRCDNPVCVNPDHLYLGSHADNMRDKKERGRVYRPTGEQHHHAKLTEALVAEIRKLCNEGANQHKIAIAYGISQPLVSMIHTGRVWAHSNKEGAA